jgi:Putative prokaryotic signal transducing protein
MEMITVFTAFNPAEAQLVCSRLDAAQFHAVVKNELSALSMDGYALAAGGILVQVPEDQAADAREFLNAPSDDTPASPIG